MSSWSLHLFKINGIPLSVHYSFFLLLAYVGYEGWTAQTWAGLTWSVLTVCAFFACVVLHELGHSFAARRYGVGVRRILLMPIGGMAEFDSLPREPSKELVITIAGPAVNFVVAALLWWPVNQLPQHFSFYSAQGLLYQLFWANVVMGLFNLVPVFPMDGGRIFRALMATKFTYLKATQWASLVGKVLSIVGAGVMYFWLDSWMGALLFTFIFMAGDAEYKAVKRHEVEEAHWRETLARMHRKRQRDDLPPIL